MQKRTPNTQIAFENYERSNPIATSSNRDFGFVFSVVFIIISFFKYKQNPIFPTSWIIGAASIFLIALFMPKLLTPFNWIWTRFGFLLHRIMNPIIMGLLFYVVITPIGIIARIFKADLLQLKFDKDAKTYWKIRDSSNMSTLKNQF